MTAAYDKALADVAAAQKALDAAIVALAKAQAAKNAALADLADAVIDVAGLEAAQAVLAAQA